MSESDNNNNNISVENRLKFNPQDFNDWADFWREIIGANVIPADTLHKRTNIAWKKYQNSPIPQEIHEQWKEENAFRNGMAVMAGKIWHNPSRKNLYLVCIDLDNKRAIDEFFVSGIDKVAQKIIVEQHEDDRNKAHVYFYSSRPFAKKSSDKTNLKLNSKILKDEIPAIEVKSLGEHGIMYCTPSLHQNGSPYTIIGTYNLDIICDDMQGHIDRICRKYDIPYLDNSKVNDFDNSLIPISELWKEDTKILEGHNRHEAILRIMESLLKRCPDYPESTLRQLAEIKNQKMCVPPLSFEEMERQWKDAKKFIIEKGNIFSSFSAQNTNSQPQQGTKGQNQITELKQKKENGGKTVIDALADILISRFSFATMDDTLEIYHYKDGVYLPNGEVLIMTECEKEYPQISKHEVNEVIAHVQRRTVVLRSDFDSEPHIVNLKNGILNLKTGNLKEHSEKYLSVTQIPVMYNPKARPKTIRKFLNSVLQKDDVLNLIEFIAYCLIKNADLQKALLLVGRPNQGKSRIMEMIRAFLGKKNTSSKTLHQLTEDRFSVAELYGKLANIFADISSKKLQDIEMFKVIVTGDRINAEKKFKNSFEFNPYAKLIFSANQPPQPPDSEDDSYYRRLIMLTVEIKNRKLKKDPQLLYKITTEQELSGLLNWVIPAAKKLIKRQHFTINKTDTELKKEYQQKSEPVRSWLADNIVHGDNLEIEKKKAYSDFIDYCKQKNMTPLEYNTFCKEMLRLGVQGRRVVDSEGNTLRHVWDSVGLR